MDSQVQKLYDIGFENVGKWVLQGDTLACELQAHHSSSNVLYVFLLDGVIAYIGKTFGRLKTRMRGYEFPEASQSTNVKNNRLISDALSSGRKVEIICLIDREILSYGGFHLNLASGLEQSLIIAFRPPWNGALKAKKNYSEELPSSPSDLGSSTQSAGSSVYESTGVVPPRTERKPQARGWTEKFRVALADAFAQAHTEGKPFLEIRAGDLHYRLSFGSNRMPLCCNAMHQARREGDEVLESPPSGLGPRLRIKYKIPRR